MGGGGGMQDDLASNLRSKVKKLQYLRVAILVAGSRVLQDWEGPGFEDQRESWTTEPPLLWHGLHLTCT
jgi:hypothetical protein